MEFVFEQDNVVDQWTEMSRRSQDGDEPIVHVLKISFESKLATNCTWIVGG
jgi:hypothetical protein